MARIIDLSKLKKEDIPVISMTGTCYLISGNFKSEYCLKLTKTFDAVKKAKEEDDLETVYAILKTWVYELISMNISGSYVDDNTGKTVKVNQKKVTPEIIDKEFNDYQAIEMLLSYILTVANE